MQIPNVKTLPQFGFRPQIRRLPAGKKKKKAPWSLEEKHLVAKAKLWQRFFLHFWTWISNLAFINLQLSLERNNSHLLSWLLFTVAQKCDVSSKELFAQLCHFMYFRQNIDYRYKKKPTSVWCSSANVNFVLSIKFDNYDTVCKEKVCRLHLMMW